MPQESQKELLKHIIESIREILTKSVLSTVFEKSAYLSGIRANQIIIRGQGTPIRGTRPQVIVSVTRTVGSNVTEKQELLVPIQLVVEIRGDLEEYQNIVNKD